MHLGRTGAAWALLVALACAPAWAVDPPNFSGVWVLDLSASDSPDAFLELTGANVVERMAARSMSVTHTIQQLPDRLIVDVDSLAANRTEVTYFDGRTTPETDRDGFPFTSTTSWSPDGKAVVTHSTIKDDAGRRIPVVLTRSLSADGKTMFFVAVCTTSDGGTIQLKRVFHPKS